MNGCRCRRGRQPWADGRRFDDRCGQPTCRGGGPRSRGARNTTVEDELADQRLELANVLGQAVASEQQNSSCCDSLVNIQTRHPLFADGLEEPAFGGGLAAGLALVPQFALVLLDG